MTATDTSMAHLALKVKRAILHVDCDTIQWFKTDGNYTTLHLTDSSTLVSRVSLKDLEEQLPAGQFVRIHKSYIINEKYITKRKANKVSMNEAALPIGRAHQKNVYAFFGHKKTGV